MSTRKEVAAAAVAAAWLNAGPMPEYHAMMQDQLRRQWPVLAFAVEQLAEAERSND